MQKRSLAFGLLLLAGVAAGMSLATETCACGPTNPRWRVMLEPYESQIRDAAKALGVEFRLPPMKRVNSPSPQPTPTYLRINV